MEPKKNPDFDLESRKGFFFLIGLALALLVMIVVFQLRIEKKAQLPPKPDGRDLVIGAPVPITKHPKEERPKKVETKTKYNKELPPKAVDDTTSLTLNDDFKPDPVDELLEYIGEELEKATEELPWELIEKVARPDDCEEVYGAEEQRACLNRYMNEFVHRNTRLPAIARRNNLQGVVTVTFVVDENGDVVDVKAILGPHDVLKEEAERVIKSLPKFIPASNNGRKARMRMNLRINFKR